MLIQTYINLTENWQITTPSNAENYKEMNKKLQKIIILLMIFGLIGSSVAVCLTYIIG
mgnify:CR=1 FL=1